MPFPTSQLLMESCVASDLAVDQSQQWQVTTQINLLAPFTNDCRVSNPVLDEHAFRLGHGQEKFVKSILIILAQRPEAASGFVFEFDLLGKFRELEFKCR